MSAQRPVLAIDIDEVLFPFTAHINDYYNQQQSAAVRLEDYADYALETAWGISREAARPYIDAFMRQEHRHIKPVGQALESIDALSGRYQLVVVTARDGEFERETKRWLLHHFPHQFEDVILAGNHFTGRNFRTKSEICRSLGAVYLIDDALHNVLDCAGAGVPGLLFGSYPWNQTTEALPANVRRVSGWDEVRQILL